MYTVHVYSYSYTCSFFDTHKFINTACVTGHVHESVHVYKVKQLQIWNVQVLRLTVVKKWSLFKIGVQYHFLTTHHSILYLTENSDEICLQLFSEFIKPW